MTDSSRAANLAQLEHLNEQQLRRLLVEHLTKQKLGLYWEANAIERDAALNADLVLPLLAEEWSCSPSPLAPDVTTSHSTKPASGQVAGYLPQAGEGNQLGEVNRLPLPLAGEGWGEGSRLRVVNDDGSLGEAADWDDLIPVQEWLRASKPTRQ